MDELRGMASIPCTNCRYCVKGCPQGVVIPEIMGLLNLELMTENRDFAKGLYSWQAAPGPASSCIACGACEAECPVSAISAGDGKYVIDEGTCISCGACAGVCPVGAPAEK